MSLYSIFNIAGSGLAAQSVRLNTVASNLANADDVASSEQAAYRARQPVFATALFHAQGGGSAVGVRVTDIQESQAPVRREYSPGNPLADKQGYVYTTNVNTVEQMANMISASRSYQNNVNVLSTTQQLLLSTVQQLGK
ncbi:flagellar basal body rod protein FlgC [Acidihalobacter prosperus]|uniref:Flagellar basal-body rod protein FlgC n=1 Tax=Acidihalobacter prosperus TaxID=160660 RepID=A0A1A6C5K1_9GAMM|nr:flagellar basal body rod protein FlgC [Acidihalobacter prosperus]OBS09846.1 flagellar basal body rod protein FlgC [Acidihalobacter prosperus]